MRLWFGWKSRRKRNNMNNNIKLDPSLLSNLSPDEKRAALEILKQYSKTGESSLYENLKYADYEEIPVDIDTFLDNDNYLGKSLWSADEFTGEKKCSLFPYWRKTLNKLFPNNTDTRYNTVILTGGIGLGKTTCAVVAQLYMLYRMLCLKDPCAHYQIQPGSSFTFSQLNITIDTAKGVAWNKTQSMLQDSPWFMNHGLINASRTEPTWQPNGNIELLFGSSNRNVIGRNLFCNISDEVNFALMGGSDVDKKKKALLKLISQIDARMISRFMRGTFLPTVNFIISSSDRENSFLDSYINIKRRNESKNTLIISEPQWVVRTDKGTPNDPGSFYVAVGNKFLANELLPIDARPEEIDAFRRKGYTMLKIPPGYRETFETDLDGALTDIAGISLASSLKFISGPRLQQAKTPDYRNPFTKDIIEVGNNPDDHTQYSDFFDLSAVNPNDMARPLFIHLDLSTSGDKTGIAGTWILGKRPTATGDNASSSSQMFYKLAFSVSVKAPKGYQVSYTKNINFIKWLRDKGFNIKCVSADTFQSTSTLQELAQAGFNTKIVSVDRLDTSHRDFTYEYLKSCIYERRVQIYQKCDLLTDELLGLEKMSSGKVDHTPEGINCLTGDTKISLVDGRELTILELLNEFNNGKRLWVYTVNEKTLKIEPKLIKNVFKSGVAKRLCKITLDNNEVITCTPNHKFMLRNGNYCEARNLQENDSLMPLYRKYPTISKMNKYRMYYEPIEDCWHFEHRQFAKKILDEYYLVHHINNNKSDNTPDNLIWCSKKLHTLIHAITETGAQSFFGFYYKNVDRNHKGVWANRYRQKMYDLYNHKVKKIELIDDQADVYDLTIQDNHNFALTAGIFVHNSKDQADGFCGSLYSASQYGDQYAYEYGDRLDASLNVSLGETELDRKTQMIIDRQKELAQIYNSAMNRPQKQRSAEEKKAKEEYQQYKDISDGIIVI